MRNPPAESNIPSPSRSTKSQDTYNIFSVEGTLFWGHTHFQILPVYIAGADMRKGLSPGKEKVISKWWLQPTDPRSSSFFEPPGSTWVENWTSYSFFGIQSLATPDIWTFLFEFNINYVSKYLNIFSPMIFLHHKYSNFRDRHDSQMEWNRGILLSLSTQEGLAPGSR